MDESQIYKGTSYQPLNRPEELKAAIQKERSEVEGLMPAYEQAIEHLRARIAFYDTLSAIPDEVLGDEQAFRETVAVNKQTVENLTPIVQELEDIISQHKR